MNAVPTVCLSNLRKGAQFNLPGDPSTVWEVTEGAKSPEDAVEVMNLQTRRVFDDMPGHQDVYLIPVERRIRLSTLQVGDRVEFTDAHYRTSGEGTICRISYPNGTPMYHLDNLSCSNGWFKTTYIAPDEYVGDKISLLKVSS